MTPTVRPATARDAMVLSPRLRAADADEFLANGRCPTAGLLRAVGLSAIANCILSPSGQPLAIVGFARIDDETGCPWMVGSADLVTTHRRWFIQHSHEIAAMGDGLFRSFFNWVDARNTAHVRWLRWVGFDVHPAVPQGPFGLLFHPFYRTAP